MKLSPFAAAAGLSLLVSTLAVAQTAAPVDHSKMDHSKMGHSKMGDGAPAKAGDAPSTAAYKAANGKMHAGMDITFSGDADVDFVNGMIPHHQGAVEMAKIVLKHGKDPELKKLAAEIVAAQDKEITFMQEWLKAKGK
jgi:uncharacterized protein (DUF305 family)